MMGLDETGTLSALNYHHRSIEGRWPNGDCRNSSFAYKGRNVDIRTVGRELGVRSVLEGSIRRAGNRLWITAQLIDAADGGHLWAERYDRDLTDIFAVQGRGDAADR